MTEKERDQLDRVIELRSYARSRIEACKTAEKNQSRIAVACTRAERKTLEEVLEIINRGIITPESKAPAAAPPPAVVAPVSPVAPPAATAGGEVEELAGDDEPADVETPAFYTLPAGMDEKSASEWFGKTVVDNVPLAEGGAVRLRVQGFTNAAPIYSCAACGTFSRTETCVNPAHPGTVRKLVGYDDNAGQ